MERGERVAAARRQRHRKAARGESVSMTSRAPLSLSHSNQPRVRMDSRAESIVVPSNPVAVRRSVTECVAEHGSISYLESPMPPNAKALAAPLVAWRGQLAAALIPYQLMRERPPARCGKNMPKTEAAAL